MNIQRYAIPSVCNKPNGQSEIESVNADQLSRRTFCNRLLASSSGLLVGTAALTSVTARQGSQLAYPPLRIEGAEALVLGSSLYFNYPSRSDGAVLVRSQSGEYCALARSVRI